MLVQFIYDSNALASFLALWEILPSKPKLPPESKASSSAGGDPVRKVIIKAGGDPVRTSSQEDKKAAKSRKRAADERSDAETAATGSVKDRKRRSTEKGSPVRRPRGNQRSERINKKAIPTSIDYLLYTQLKDKLDGSKRLKTEEAVEVISKLARFPFTVRPGDWFKTRPAGTDVRRPVPHCREILVCEALDSRLKVTSAKRPREDSSDEAEEVITACLPHNYIWALFTPSA